MPDWAYRLLMYSCAGVAAFQLISNAMAADIKMIIINIVVLHVHLTMQIIRYISNFENGAAVVIPIRRKVGFSINTIIV